MAYASRTFGRRGRCDAALPILSRCIRPLLRVWSVSTVPQLPLEYSAFYECPTRWIRAVRPCRLIGKAALLQSCPRRNASRPISYCEHIYTRFTKLKRTFALAHLRTTMLYSRNARGREGLKTAAPLQRVLYALAQHCSAAKPANDTSYLYSRPLSRPHTPFGIRPDL